MQDAARLPFPGWALALFTLGCVDYQVERRPNIDSWTQPSRDSGVDILWVVDNSCSMSEEQEQLSLHATSFVSFLSNAAVDFRLVVTTTDPDPKSLPFDYDPVTMTADTADLATVFAQAVEVGTEGGESVGRRHQRSNGLCVVWRPRLGRRAVDESGDVHSLRHVGHASAAGKQDCVGDGQSQGELDDWDAARAVDRAALACIARCVVEHRRHCALYQCGRGHLALCGLGLQLRPYAA